MVPSKKQQRIFVLLCLLLVLFQFQDGYWTYLGVSRFGIDAEGNPLIKWLLVEFGVVFGLMLPKLLAFVFIWFIYTAKTCFLNSTMIALVFVDLFYLWSAIRWYLILFA